METRTGRSIQDHPSTPALTAPVTVPVPPPSTRRPRVREVSSRFMSPVSSSSSSSGDHHYHHQNQPSVSTQKSRRQLKLADGDENRNPEPARILHSPYPLDGGKKQQPLRENGHRRDTPTPMLPPPSRSRLNQQRLLISSAAARLLRLSVSTDGEEDIDKEKSNGSLPTRNHTKLSPVRRSLSSSCDDSSSCRACVGLSLPPVAPKSQADTKRHKKVLRQQNNAHCLKLLHNRYLQWRFANAKVEVKSQAQKSEAKRMFYSLGLKMSELFDTVQKKRIELQGLMRVKALKEIVEPQMPSLEQWTTLEEEYSTSLLETSEALLNASLRLPLDVDIKVDTKELGEVLVVASKSMEGIVQNIVQYMPKTQEIESLLSELARVSSREKVAVEDCGVALLKTHSSHVEDCCLRSQLIQHYDESRWSLDM